MSTSPEKEVNLPAPIHIESERVKEMITEVIRSKQNDILAWPAIETLTKFFYLYLFKKYKHNCRIRINTTDEEGNISKNLGINYDLSKTPRYNQLISREAAMQFKGCYDAGDDMIVIPIGIKDSKSGHANFLLFKREPNTIERFEPYGYKLSDELKDVERHIRTFVDEVNSLLARSQARPIMYIPFEESCDEFGIQALEGIEVNTLGLKRQENEGGGYCAIWSLFLTELSLANPSMTQKELIQIITHVKIESNTYFIDIARGYVYLFYEKMEKYIDNFLPENMNLKKFANITILVSTGKIPPPEDAQPYMDALNTLNDLFDIDLELFENPDLTSLIKNYEDAAMEVQEELNAINALPRKSTADNNKMNELLQDREELIRYLIILGKKKKLQKLEFMPNRRDVADLIKVYVKNDGRLIVTDFREKTENRLNKLKNVINYFLDENRKNRAAFEFINSSLENPEKREKIINSIIREGEVSSSPFNVLTILDSRPMSSDYSRDVEVKKIILPMVMQFKNVFDQELTQEGGRKKKRYTRRSRRMRKNKKSRKTRRYRK